MPEHSTAAPSRSVAKPLRIAGTFRSFGPGRVSILEATGAAVATKKAKLSGQMVPCTASLTKAHHPGKLRCREATTHIEREGV